MILSQKSHPLYTHIDEPLNPWTLPIANAMVILHYLIILP